MRDGGPKSCKRCRKVWKYDGPGLHFGSTLRFRGAAGMTLDGLRDSFGFNLGSAGSAFSHFLWKSWICGFRRRSRAESSFLQVPAPKWEPLGQKSRTRSVQNGCEMASQRGQDRQVWLVGSVFLSKLWESPETSPELSQVGGQSLSKRQNI